MGSMKYKDVKIELFGHASVMLEWNGLTVYIDPYVLPENPKKADIVLFTHDHYDHCVDPEKLLKEDTETISVACRFAKRRINIGDEIEVKGVKIKAVPAYNIDKPFHPKGKGAGYIITMGDVSVYHAGDTDAIPEMKDYRCDVALVPIGGKYTMDVEEAVKAISMIKPKIAVPMHYNTFEGIEASPSTFKEKVESLGVTCMVLY